MFKYLPNFLEIGVPETGVSGQIPFSMLNEAVSVRLWCLLENSAFRQTSKWNVPIEKHSEYWVPSNLALSLHDLNYVDIMHIKTLMNNSNLPLAKEDKEKSRLKL